MKEGRITKKANDWSGLQAHALDIPDNRYYKRDMDYSSDHYNSCASAALSLLTNIPVKKVDEFYPKEAWSTKMIIKFLRSKGYTVVEVSKGGILSHKWSGAEPALSEYHCLLINANSDSVENSLYIMHENKIYHHFHLAATADPLFFFNRPTQDVLLVYHKKWKGKGFSWGWTAHI